MEVPTGPQSRQEYLETEGFLLFTDVGHQMFDELARKRPRSLERRTTAELVPMTELVQEYPAEAALLAVGRELFHMIPRRDKGIRAILFDQRFGVSSNDRAQTDNFHVLGHGFLDPDFTWHFAPAIAAGVMHEFETAGIVSPEEHQSMTLNDWANIIGSGWFSSLIHSMAHTAPISYASFGKNEFDYAPNAVRNLLNRLNITTSPDAGVFNLTQQLEPTTDETYWAASLPTDTKAALRKRKGPHGSGTCPVARLGTKLSPDTWEHDPHAKRLHKLGILTVSEHSDPSSDKVHVHQQYTAINNALMVLADQLDNYSDLYGEPTFPFGDVYPGKIIHEFRENTVSPKLILPAVV